jgi:hypothetical protein
MSAVAMITAMKTLLRASRWAGGHGVVRDTPSGVHAEACARDEPIGRDTRNTVARTSLSAETVPPCARTISCTM